MLSILFSNFNNKPKQLLTYKSTIINQDANLSSPDNFTPRWLQSNITTYGTIAANTDVWFGFWGEHGETRFDYGTPLFQTFDVSVQPEYMKNYNSLYEMFSDYEFTDISNCNDLYYGGQYSHREPNVYPGVRYDLKASMYLGIPAAYTRTMTQGVKLADSRKLAAAYVRKHTAAVKGVDVLGRVVDTMRRLADTAGVEGIPLRSLGVFIKLVTVGFVRDFILRRFLKSNEELVLKSKVCREIILDSKIH
jgi:hypothetical protein